MTHIFASDYDGTLYHNKPISQEDLVAIHRFRAKGYKFGIVTGRSINSIFEEAQAYKIPFDFLVGVNGGCVLDHGLNQINNHKIKDEVVKDLLQVIDDFGVIEYGVSEGYLHTDVDYENYFQNEFNNDLDFIVGNGISGIYIHTYGNEEALELANVINERFNKNDIRCSSNNQYIDIDTISNSKTTGIDDVVNFYKYQGQIYTVGDSYNDVPMLRDFFRFLMGNGVLSLEKFAKGGIV